MLMARKGSMQLPEYVAHPATVPPEDPDLLEQLSFEHRQMQRLWGHLQLAHRRHVEDVHRPEARYGSSGQRALGQQLVQVLARHEALELEMLYPVVARTVGEEWAEHARSDHADVRDLLDEVDGENPEDEGVFDIFSEVLTKVLAHIDEEEKIIFPMLRAVVPSTELGKPGQPAQHEPAPPPEVVDLAGAEREAAAPPEDGGNGRKDKIRRRLLRR